MLFSKKKNELNKIKKTRKIRGNIENKNSNCETVLVKSLSYI